MTPTDFFDAFTLLHRSGFLSGASEIIPLLPHAVKGFFDEFYKISIFVFATSPGLTVDAVFCPVEAA